MDHSSQVILLGVRGSVPLSGTAFEKYGGSTLCVLVKMGGETILLDCGTGAMQTGLLTAGTQRLTILLSHPHVDHLLGLPMCPFLYEEGRQATFCSVPRDRLSARQQAKALMSPPLWPLGFEAFRAELAFEDLLMPTFQIGSVSVALMELSHPGGATAFRLSCNGRSIVYATDCEIFDDQLPRLAAFAQDCDLLLCDGQYADEEYPLRQGWGHSSWSMAAALGKASQAKRTVLIHHAPEYTDTYLDEADRWLRAHRPGCTMGKCGEEFRL